MRVLGAFFAIAAGLLAQPAFDSDLALSGFLNQFHETLERQPNYTCLETIERTRRSPGGNTQVEDTLRLEVALVDSKEMFAWPGSQEFEDQDLTELVSSGMFGNGNFAIYPRMLFGGGGPPFVYAGEVEINGRKAAQYNFRVSRPMSGYQLSVNRQRVTVGYHGSFYIDMQTLDLRRIAMIPDDLPPEFQMTGTEDRVDYDRVPIGDERFLLPVESNLMMAFPEVVSRNRVRFSGCRKFTGESTILFPEEDVLDGPSPPPITIREVVLPLGTEVRLSLTSDIVLAEGVGGDVVEAKLSTEIKAGRDVLVPKGATAHGRILRLERQPEVFVLELRFTDLEWKGGHARLNLKFQKLGPTVTSPRQSIDYVPAGGEIVIPRGGLKRLKDATTYWHVVP